MELWRRWSDPSAEDGTDADTQVGYWTDRNESQLVLHADRAPTSLLRPSYFRFASFNNELLPKRWKAMTCGLVSEPPPQKHSEALTRI